MPLHPQAKAVLERRAASQPKTPPTTQEERLKAFENTWREAGPEVYKTEDRRIPGSGGEIPVRIYWPSEEGPLPVLIEFHGGGFMHGDIESYDGNCRRLSIGAGCVVVNVDYRKAPDHKFPAAAEDCYAVTKWAMENAASINVDPTKIAVGGDSAGGNLATVVSLMARDRGGPSIALQILMVPAVHRAFSPLTYDREETPGGKAESTPMNGGWLAYLRDETDATNIYACPIIADLTGLPPALVLTAEFDTFRDEGKAYAEKLKQAGVPTIFKEYEGMFHQFHMYPSYVDGGKEGLNQEIERLRAAFAQ